MIRWVDGKQNTSQNKKIYTHTHLYKNTHMDNTSKNLAAYYAILATTTAVAQQTEINFFRPDEDIDSQLEKAREEIKTLRVEVAALKADNAGLTKALYNRMTPGHR